MGGTRLPAEPAAESDDEAGKPIGLRDEIEGFAQRIADLNEEPAGKNTKGSPSQRDADARDRVGQRAAAAGPEGVLVEPSGHPLGLDEVFADQQGLKHLHPASTSRASVKTLPWPTMLALVCTAISAWMDPRA